MNAQDTAAPATEEKVSQGHEQTWNWHLQNTEIVQYHPHLSARYSGPSSMSTVNEVKETVSLDLFVARRLWKGAEFHIDGFMWQGFGLSGTHGIEAFPNGEAFRTGTKVPNVNFSRLFIRQTIGLGGEEEERKDDALHLAGSQDVSRLTFTVGRMSAKDIFDNNSYANDARSQFMNWAFTGNEAWDIPSDALGYISGLAVELNQPNWALRYGFFQVPRHSNHTATDPNYLKGWGMVSEFERRFTIAGRKGAVRLMAFLNEAHMGSYQEALDSDIRPADIIATEKYRLKYGFGLNIEQELTKNFGLFSRIGWSDGHTEAWMFTDVDRTATLGLSLKGELWHRPDDTVGIAGVVNGISEVHQRFLAAGGTGILAGDGRLTYGLEKGFETYYDCQIWRTLHAALDYQFITNPAFNRDRGPVSVVGARVHWEF